MESLHLKLLFTSHFICFTLSTPQEPEINDQFVSTTAKEVLTDTSDIVIPTTTENGKMINVEEKEEGKMQIKFQNYRRVTNVATRPSFLTILYEIVSKPIEKFISSPKVNIVLRNVGTCLVNGVMEIISYYLPAPIIPLIATAAGMMIPFEPVVMLKEKMPVTSYRRAFRKAMNSFLNTFDGYKLDDDPYMTRRFNRRFMNDISGERDKKSK